LKLLDEVCFNSLQLNLAKFSLYNAPKATGIPSDERSSVTEKLQTVLPASNSELQAFLVPTHYHIDCSCPKSRKGVPYEVPMFAGKIHIS